MALEFQFTSPSGKVVRLCDLPIEDLQDIADKAGIESWYDIYSQPARFGKPSVALYKHCCGITGDKPAEPVTIKVIVDAFELVPDDRPTQYEDGIPETDAQTTD